MIQILLGSLLISLLHALIPNHWIPVVAIGKKQNWNLGEVVNTTFISACAHVASTVLIGVILGVLGVKLSGSIDGFTQLFAPLILIGLGVFFILQHHYHKHFSLPRKVQKQTRRRVVFALILAMFFSPCLEIEALFLLAGTKGWWAIAAVAIMYGIITITGMTLWVRFIYLRIVRLDWHKLEHYAGIITGTTLIITGLLSFFFTDNHESRNRK